MKYKIHLDFFAFLKYINTKLINISIIKLKIYNNVR